jgi:hypothetical protein
MAIKRNLPKAVSPVREPRDTGPEVWPPVKLNKIKFIIKLFNTYGTA